MDKTLDAVTLIHRLIIVVALALFIVGLSLHPADDVYTRALIELQPLEDGIHRISDEVDQSYSDVEDKSELKSSILAWLKQRNLAQNNIYIDHVIPDNLTVPDSTVNPLVTVDAQVRFADRAYRRGSDNLVYFCSVERTAFFEALDKLFGSSPKPKVNRLTVSVLDAVGGARSGAAQHLNCEIAVEYETQTGAYHTTILNVRNKVLETAGSDVAEAFKGQGLGDPEDTARFLYIPSLRALWSDIGSRTPEAAMEFLA
jgi:predicted XRE-type DNA-binding protein